MSGMTWEMTHSYITGKYIYKTINPSDRLTAISKGTCEEISRKTTLDPFEAKQQLCGKLGFPIGSQDNGNCVHTSKPLP